MKIFNYKHIQSRVFLSVLVILFLMVAFNGKKSNAQELDYQWKQSYYATLAGAKSMMFAREMRKSKLAFADIDGDKDLDLFMGQSNGQIAYFENQGSRENPNYILITQTYQAIFESHRKGRKINIRNRIDVGDFSAPSLVDIDSDGDLDLFVGSERGNIWFFKNAGNNLIPNFQLIDSNYQQINMGKNSTLLFADVHLQRKQDLLVGTIDGIVWLFVNSGTRKKADYRSVKPLKVVQFGLDTHAVPALHDWDKDGDLDLIVGQNNGSLTLFDNVGTQFDPKWVLKERNFQLIDIGGESAPVFIDFDNDGDQDLFIGSANTTAAQYENRFLNQKRIFWNKTNNALSYDKLINAGSRASIAIGDLDADGDPDFIVGEQAGNLNYFINQGDVELPDWVLVTEELLFMTGFRASAPALGDLDNDGDLDLLVGDKAGHIALIKNVGSPKRAKWKLLDKIFFKIDVGSNSVPRLFDIDGDGDLDLFIGNFTGRVIFYENTGTPKQPNFKLASSRFADAKVENNAVPAFYDWNLDKIPDLIVGGTDGKINLYIAPLSKAKASEDWSELKGALAEFNVDALAHPIFYDFDKDNKLDLLLGNKEGDFLLYLFRDATLTSANKTSVVDNSIDQQAGSLVVEEAKSPELLASQTLIDEINEQSENVEDYFALEGAPEKVKIDPKFNNNPVTIVDVGEIKRSSPALGDLDQDGDLDLLVGSRSGRVLYFENVGSERNWEYRLISKDYLKTSDLNNTTPALIDLDQDGDLDIILGTKTGKLVYFDNQGSMDEPNYVLSKDMFQQLWQGMNSKPSATDLDGDGLLDLLVGNLWGKLTFIRNESDQFIIERRDYGLIDIGVGSSPSFSDLNNSGSTEMIIGADSGRIAFFRNDKEDFSGTWNKLSDYGGKIDYPIGASPIVFDLDNDGDPDLITGSELGSVLLYNNDAINRFIEQNIEAPTSE